MIVIVCWDQPDTTMTSSGPTTWQLPMATCVRAPREHLHRRSPIAPSRLAPVARTGPHHTMARPPSAHWLRTALPAPARRPPRPPAAARAAPSWARACPSLRATRRRRRPPPAPPAALPTGDKREGGAIGPAAARAAPRAMARGAAGVGPLTTLHHARHAAPHHPAPHGRPGSPASRPTTHAP